MIGLLFRLVGLALIVVAFALAIEPTYTSSNRTVHLRLRGPAEILTRALSFADARVEEAAPETASDEFLPAVAVGEGPALDALTAEERRGLDELFEEKLRD